MERAYCAITDGGGGEEGATGASEAGFGGVEAAEILEVGWCRGNPDGLDLDAMWVVREELQSIEVMDGELQVGCLVVESLAGPGMM